MTLFTKKNISIFIALLILSGIFFLRSPQDKKQYPLIAITQIIDHNTLDVVRKGLIDGLAQHGFIDGKTVRIIYENAHGNVTIAAQIAQKFASLSPQVMVGLSTQSAQILQPLTTTTTVPLVFSAVTDPVSARLVSSWSQTSMGITGISDYMDAAPQLSMIKDFIPHIKTLGVLFNPAEINSVSFLTTFEETAKKMGITIIRAALNNTSEAAAAMNSLVNKVDAVYFPNDNTAMSAVGAIVHVGMKHSLPVFANDSASVKQGAAAALAYDRYQMGMETAKIVAGLMRGRKTADFPVTNQVPMEIVMNSKSCHQLELSIPKKQPIQDVAP